MCLPIVKSIPKGNEFLGQVKSDFSEKCLKIRFDPLSYAQIPIKFDALRPTPRFILPAMQTHKLMDFLKIKNNENG